MADVDTVWTYVIIGVAILVGAVAYGVSLVRGRSSTVEREAPPARPGLPAEDLDRRPPTGSESRAMKRCRAIGRCVGDESAG